jgi:D-lyxose ketol-isomerase
MKRSEIDGYIEAALELCREWRFALPAFAAWTPQAWQARGHEYDEIRDCHLGWDLTDFGSVRFAEIGLIMFTLRNGNAALDRYAKTYSQKLLVVGDRQVTPCHFHFDKMEDIICHTGGDLLVQVYNSDGQGGLARGPVPVRTDGHWQEVPAGTVLRFEPGQSISLPPRQYHKFWAEGQASLVVEVASIDAGADNRFLEDLPRFPAIEEDAPARHLLCTEYPGASESAATPA